MIRSAPGQIFRQVINDMNQNEISREKTVKETIGALYDVMRTEKLEELEIKDRDFYLHVKRKGRASAQQQAVTPVATVQTSAAVEAPAAPEVCTGETIKSPIMGVFYRAPSPSSPPFASEGDLVESGKTLCIVEAMKVMNEIKADFRVKIVKILLENGKVVNAGQDMFVIERA